ncbi:MAG: phosphate acyltransferase, partial [Candidatus Syntrophosphaera sp.]
MSQIKKLDQLAEHVRNTGAKTRIAVAAGEDVNTLSSLGRAAEEGFVQGILLGNRERIKQLCTREGLDPKLFEIIGAADAKDATVKAVRMVRSGEADVLMKGMVGTDTFLKAVLDKEQGLLPKKAVMSYVCTLEIPRYHKLLFISDTAVLP